MKEISIKEAEKQHAALILKFVKDLARYEKAENQVTAEVADIEASIFGPEATVKALICYLEDEPVGFAVYFYNYSTWQGKKGIYLEDLYVSPESRKVGAGKAILKYLARKAVSENCGRFEWSVLDWNEPAIRFYESTGARRKKDWVGYRLSADALREFSK